MRQALLTVALAGVFGPQRRRAPSAASGGTDFEAITWENFDAGFLGAQGARRAFSRYQAIVVGNAVLAAEHAAGSMARAVARGIATRRLFGFQHEIERNAEPAAKLPVTARAGAIFVVTEVQWKAHL